MKTSIHCFALLAFATALPSIRAGDQPSPPPKEEKRTLRVISGSDNDTAHPGAKIEHRLFAAGRSVAGEKETVAFLGVETSSVSPTLTAQLALPNGSGLVVNRIVPDSSAVGVLKEHDILLKLDDQILIEQHQLMVLIRNHKEGDEVAVTYIRAGKQATAKVKLGKHDVPKMTVFDKAVTGGGGSFVFAPGDGTFEMPVPFQRGAEGREDVDRMLSLMDHQPGEPVRIRIEHNDGPGLRATSINTGNSSLVFSDDEGSLDLTIKDGQKTLIAKNAKGEQVFSGPVTSPEERKAVPAGVRERLERLEGMHDVTFRTDGDFKGAETMIMRPPGRGIALPPAPRPQARPALFF